MRKAASKASLQFIFITVLLDAIGLGLLIPVLPDVLRRFVSDPNLVSEYYGYFLGVYAAMQFIASPVLGSLSDRFGRRPILLASLAGAGIDYIFMAVAPTLGLLFVGRLISGLTGASMTVANSYLADISDDSNRSKNFGMVGAAWGLGFIFGPLLGGSLSFLGTNGPFWAAAVLTLLNFMFGYFVLPESLSSEHRRQLNWQQLNPLRSVIKVLKPSPYVMLVWIFFIVFLAGQVHPVNWTLYAETKFHWSSWEVGLSLSFVGICITAVQAGLTGPLVKKLGEQPAFTIGAIIQCLSFALFGLATDGWMMYPVILFFALSGITMPALQTMVTQLVPANEQGELQGSLISLGSLASILAPLLFSYLFTTFTKTDAPLYFPGAAYLGASALCVIAVALSVRFGKRSMA